MAIIVDGKTYRNLQEQVLYLSDNDIKLETNVIANTTAIAANTANITTLLADVDEIRSNFLVINFVDANGNVELKFNSLGNIIQ